MLGTKGISWIGSGLGAPMLTSRPWLDPTQLGEAKILVEVKLDKPFPPKVAIEDESGSITMVDVFYSWLPPKCVKCGQLGHKATRCLGILPSKQNDQPSIANDKNNVILAKTTTPLISEDTTSVKTVSASLQPSAHNIKSSGIKDVSTVPVGTSSATTNTPLISEDTTTVKTVSASLQPSAQNIKSCGIKDVSTAPVGTSSNEVLLISENMEITLPIAAIPEAGPRMTEIASHSDGIINSGDLSPPASPNALPTLRDDTSTLEATTIVTDAEDGSSVCRSLDTEAFQGNADFVDDEIMRTQSGRTVKPSQKLQEMEWSTAKGKRGRKGRGGKYG